MLKITWVQGSITPNTSIASTVKPIFDNWDKAIQILNPWPMKFSENTNNLKNSFITTSDPIIPSTWWTKKYTCKIAPYVITTKPRGFLFLLIEMISIKVHLQLILQHRHDCIITKHNFPKKHIIIFNCHWLN